ncbi:lycopene cyclase family protein [Hymenobacter latericus]|uniref:lycopene cyclase family protein n=1 Tax=Hymenobacter sp. YIM 151858-1 TaxID=2987688 RepID=UPI002226FD20|nr:lycopene cyclase family protein [Hymenobacter sp. YIM 151858-1]UYZ61103.1 lycopene cyclase family protein [Hymenobacter sp. YIM 151858-1]
MTPPDFDYLLAGGGAAGLSLAYHLSQEPRLRHKRVLLLEPEEKNQNDRTWSFWADRPTPYDAVLAGQWRQLAFRSPELDAVLPLQRHRYCTLRGLDFYRFVQQALDARPEQFTVVQARVEQLENTPTGVAAHTSAGTFTARYAFDSRPPKPEPRPNKRYLWQHFVGWEVEADYDAFDARTPVFMDFRVPQHHECRFVYVLPFSPRRALVEYTLFSGQLLPQAEYEQALRDYLATALGGRPYRIAETEAGAIPMTDHVFAPRTGTNIVHLGTRGGRVKASTGYAFLRMQQHAERLTAALASTGALPANLTGDAWQFRLFDTLLLDIMQREGERTGQIFSELFRNNPVERILDFLDERTTWAENFQVMNSVTPWPFMQSIANVLRGKPGQRR